MGNSVLCEPGSYMLWGSLIVVVTEIRRAGVKTAVATQADDAVRVCIADDYGPYAIVFAKALKRWDVW